jgi:hypothetical protein
MAGSRSRAEDQELRSSVDGLSTRVRDPTIPAVGVRVVPLHRGRWESLVIDDPAIRRPGGVAASGVFRLLRAEAAHSSEELLKRLPTATAECAWPLNGLSSEWPCPPIAEP